MTASQGTTPPALRPKDAATMIIVRRAQGRPVVLLGKRHESHRFMPGKFVFPGGRVDFADTRVKPVGDLAASETEKLLTRIRGNSSSGRARGFALAAVRETFEETGIALGRTDGQVLAKSKAPAWQAFLDQGVRPDLSPLRFVARAITPPGRPRRYDTRFFLTYADDWGDVDFAASTSAELTEVHWLTLADAQELDLPRVTRFLLGRLDEVLPNKGRLPTKLPIPYFYHRGASWRQDTL